MAPIVWLGIVGVGKIWGRYVRAVHREAGVGVATVFVEASRDKDGRRRLVNTEG